MGAEVEIVPINGNNPPAAASSKERFFCGGKYMAAERQITTEIFVPIEEQTTRAGRQLMLLMGDFFGRGRLSLYRGISNGSIFPKEVAKEIDKWVLGSVRQNYGLPSRVDPQEFYMQQLRQTRALFRHIGNHLPELEQTLALKDEIMYLPDTPSYLVWLLSRPPKDINRRLAYETQREVPLLHISAMLNARALKRRSRTVIFETQNHLNQTVFEGPLGDGDDVCIESVHDDETNTVVGFREDMKKVPPTAHLKKIRFTVRNIPGIGPVYTSPRKKDDGVSTIKVLSKAQRNGGVIDINVVEDSIAMMIVPMNPHQSPEEVGERVVENLQSGPREIERIVQKDNVDDYRGGSPGFGFSYRRKIWFKGDPVHFELAIPDLKSYLNADLEVGTRDPGTGFYLGSAHDLYSLRRLAIVLPILYHQSIFHIDFERPVVNRMQQIAQALRAMHRVH